MPPFEEGDMLPDIILPNSDSRLVRFNTNVGDAHQVLLFCPDPRLPACGRQLESFARHHGSLEPIAKVFGITNTGPAENAAFLAEHALPFTLLSDLERQVANGLGITHNIAGGYAADGEGAFSIVVSDVSHRVLRIWRNATNPDPAPGIVDFLHGLPRREARSLGHFAPVLYVPRVLERDFCRSLIDAFESGDNQPSGVYRRSGPPGESERVIDPTHKVRRDHLVTDPVLLDGIRRRMGRRVLPEIEKAFTRQVSGVEELKVVRYDADDGGHFKAHRDNMIERQAHRRFAMTLNLNAGDYEGGALRFPEYGPDLYAPDTGDAVVFSCSLLHEAMPVTKGHRYVLLTFMFDEESRQLNAFFRR